MNSKNNIIKYISWTGFISTVAIIFYLTSQDTNATISLTKSAVDVLPTQIIQPNINSIQTYLLTPRRMAHIYEFGLLGFFAGVMLFSTLKVKKLYRVIIAIIISFIISLSDQIHKIFVPGREFDARDLVLDAIGYISSILFVTVIYLVLIMYLKPQNQIN